MKQTYASLLDRLLDDCPDDSNSDVTDYSVIKATFNDWYQYCLGLKRDLENLFSSRPLLESLNGGHYLKDSIVAYGLTRTENNGVTSIQNAIERFEPRLKNISPLMEDDKKGNGAYSFFAEVEWHDNNRNIVVTVFVMNSRCTVEINE